MVDFENSRCNNVRRKIWPLLFLISSIGIVLMWTQTFEFYPHEKLATDRANWKQFLILPFYFTFLSNFLAVLVSGYRSMGCGWNEKFMRRAEIFMVVNLTITMGVYWSMIFPSANISSTFTFASTFWIHVVTPVASIIVFFLHNHNYSYKVKMKPIKTAIQNMVFPVLWLAVAITIYYSLGGTENDAIYKFLNFNNQAWYLSIAFVAGIGIVYFGFTWFYTKLTNK